MYLKEIGIKGFKSFANSIKLNIPSGITVIVGPNGCGKSNIVDAIRWLLGEQNVRSLRGNKITDMIFSGNKNQKVRNFAQVYMLFDNNDRKFSIDSEEVEVKRIIYRSGEIENYINGNICKLRDIQELFLTSGLGKNSYSIIAQGKVDFLLNAKASERRILFEEASDIAIYHNKKENALKKLEATENNLVRINDILYQVEETLSHYKKKSEDLEIYKSYQDHIQKLEYYLLSHQYKLLQKNIIRNNKKLESFKNNILRISETLACNKNKVRQIEHEKEQLEKQLEKGLAEFQTNQINKNNLTNQLLITKQKKSEIMHFSQKIKEDIINAQNQYQKFIENLAEIDIDIKETYKKEEYLKECLKKVEGLLEKYNEIYKYYRNRVHTAEDMLNNLKTCFSNNLEEKIKRETELKSKKESLSEIEKENNYLKNKLIDNQKLVKSLSSELSILEDHIKLLNEQEKLKQRELSEKQMLVEKGNKILQNYLSDLTLKTKEVKLWEDLLEINKINSTGNDNLVLEKDILKNIITFCDLKKVITEIPENLKQIFNYILEEGIKCIHLPVWKDIPSLKKIMVEKNVSKIKIIANNLILNKNNFAIFGEDSGLGHKILGFFPQLVSFPSEYKSIVEALFGHILIVEDGHTALSIAQQRKGKWIIISLDGILINEKGIVIIDTALNDMRKDNYEIPSKRILELKHEMQFINTEVKKKQLFLKTEKEYQKKLHYEIENIKNQLTHNINNINDKNIKLQEIKNKISDSLSLLQLLKNRKKDEITKVENIEKELVILNKNITDYQNCLNYVSLYVNTLIKIQDCCHYYINKIKKNIDSYTVELSWNNERRQLLEKRKNEMKYFIKSFHQEKKDRENKLEQYNIEYRKLSDQEEELQQNLDSISKLLNIQSNGINKSKEILKELENMFRKLREKIELIQEDLSNKQNELNECKMLYIHYQEKLNNLFQTINNQYNASLNDILRFKNYANSQTEALDKITQYKEQIKEMGQINFSAFQEYQEQLTKYKEIYNKKEDIVQSKEKLLALINKIDQIAEAHFLKTFQEIQTYFNETFKKLFSGGEVSLELTNKQKPLESGIEVLVQPPGKRVKNISLLSTGEKALTAIALLFALWKANPTPFCFFDEIDSALDEANAIRLASFLKNDELKDSQIILITHQKRIMQAADALYGITMDGYGTSKLMSVKMIEQGGSNN